jgi:hypothetical protein
MSFWKNVKHVAAVNNRYTQLRRLLTTAGTQR